jgi:hypothetical protein
MSNKLKTSLHFESKIPGGVHCPAIIDVIERKISLVHQLQSLCEGKGSDFTTQPGRNIKEMIDIELRAIYEMIEMDK